MRRRAVPGIGKSVVRVVALVSLIVTTVVSSTSSATAEPGDTCSGDEQMLLTPGEPHVGEPLLVAAMSRFPHAARPDQIQIGFDFGDG